MDAYVLAVPSEHHAQKVNSRTEFFVFGRHPRYSYVFYKIKQERKILQDSFSEGK